MLGRPFLHGSGLVNTVVVRDYVNSACGVAGSDALERLDELNRWLSVKYLVDEAACADILGPGMLLFRLVPGVKTRVCLPHSIHLALRLRIISRYRCMPLATVTSDIML
jgi:hypothetical protein